MDQRKAMKYHGILSIWFGALFGGVALCAQGHGADKVEFNRDIRPILSENCFRCHGPDSASRKADLRFDRREAALKAEAFVPGKPEKSELVRRIFSESPKERMPPPASRKELTRDQKELLRRWIAEGAEYQPHWSFLPPKRPELPPVKNVAWVKNPIDRFVLQKLEDRGLTPAPEADRRSLARRLSLDLTGLPPSPGEVDAFVNDPSPDAYEALVERLLDSPQWGEHRARYWLDVARYADTHGIHFDNYREIWAYRDWVIHAFNRNMPFDEFTVEQLAGDLLENRTLEDQVASGFNRCHLTTNEGGAIPEEYLVLYTRDRTETTSQVWLGLTAGCAVCHDHKFDPLTQREFYELASFFNNTTQGAMDGNIKDTPPVVPVPLDEDRKRWEALKTELADARKGLEERKAAARPDFEKWLSEAGAETTSPPTAEDTSPPTAEDTSPPTAEDTSPPTARALASLIPQSDLRLHARLSEGEGNNVRLLLDGRTREVSFSGGMAWEAGHVAARAFKSQPGGGNEIGEAGDFERDQPFSCGAWVKIPKSAPPASIVARMDDGHGYRGWDVWFENGRIASHLVHKWDEDALKVMTKSSIKADEWNHVLVTYDGSSKAEGVKLYINGLPQEAEVPINRLKSTIRTEVPFKIAQRHSGSRLDGLLIQDLRIYGRALSPEDVGRLSMATRAAWLAGKPKDQRTPAEEAEIYEGWLRWLDEPHRQRQARLAALEKEESAIKERGTFAHVMQERGEAAMAYILFRGEYDKRRDQVKPGTPAILPPMPPELPKTRLGLARWLLRPEHPLTARVTVNRFWQEIFGTGIVRTAGDFGASGEPPSHPELLDWLAVEFRESGWDVKQLFELLVTSAAYRQSAAMTPEKLEKDPQNRLLSRGPRFRMDAEMIRDYALAASGLLVGKIGGPSVKPYQPEGVWEAVAMMESNTRYYKQDSGEKLYRRSLYTFWKRAAPPASMDILNAPSREVCTVRRERTDTPLQALVTLNDPQFVEAARHLAQMALKEGGGATGSRIELMAKRLLSRPLRPEESQVAEASLQGLFDYYKSNPNDAKKLVSVGESTADPSIDPVELAAWTMLANQLMNLDEVLNK
jgi:hypothetical protein